jgi:hypothetical protein
MPRTDFDILPDDARLWVFAASRPLGPDESRTLLDRVDGFLEGWNAHGHPLTGAREWREDRFLLIGVDEASAPPSGCSIDALHRILKEFEASRDVVLTDHADVLYRDAGGRVESASRLDFARKAKAGEVDLETPVFDTTLTRKSDLAAGFEVAATDGWHRRAFWRHLD